MVPRQVSRGREIDAASTRKAARQKTAELVDFGFFGVHIFVGDSRRQCHNSHRSVIRKKADGGAS